MPNIMLGFSVSAHIIVTNIHLTPYDQVFTEEDTGSGLSGWTQAVQITSDSETLAQVIRLRPQACSTTRLCVSTSSHMSLGEKSM